MIQNPFEEKKEIIIIEREKKPNIIYTIVSYLLVIILLVFMGFYFWNFKEIYLYNNNCNDCVVVKFNKDYIKGTLKCVDVDSKKVEEDFDKYLGNTLYCPYQNVTYYPVRYGFKELKTIYSEFSVNFNN